MNPTKDLRALLEATLTGLGYDLVDVDLAARGLLRVFIDKPEKAGGVDVEDCALVSRHLARLFEVERVSYDHLEVSSPGLDRPLKKAADFARFAGEAVRLSLRVPLVGAQCNYRGKLLGMRDGKVVLQLETKDKTCPPAELLTDLDNIAKARLAPEF
ncbi:MAG: ribosome maturation factor RimP [Zoogloeaceae bacterium]|jgi:ribosome maturation factor RimP|nr:ribosome maturation factor RimP [Zoogloeaceae bacterium]